MMKEEKAIIVSCYAGSAMVTPPPKEKQYPTSIKNLGLIVKAIQEFASL